MKKRGKMKKSQISFEYLIIMGFVTFILVGVLGIALFYGNTIKDRIKITEMENCANKIISTAESVFYAGEPSKATITCYFPENIKEIKIDETDGLIITIQTSSGKTTRAFSSNVPINGTLGTSGGLYRIEINATENKALISQV